MSFNLDEFTHIVSAVEDVLSMLDDAQLSVSTTIESSKDDDDDDDIQSWVVLNLSFPLKNGFVNILIADEDGTISYNNKLGELVKEIEFDDSSVADLTGSFHLALKGILIADKQVSKNKYKQDSTLSTATSEMDKLRAELLSFN